MGKVDVLTRGLFESLPEKGLKKFRLELPIIDFIGANVEQYRWGGKIQWAQYFQFLIKDGLLRDQEGQVFQEHKAITGIKLLFSDGELLLADGMTSGNVTVFTERTKADAPTFCAWPGAYLLEKYLRDKGTSVAKLTELGKWFVEISTLNDLGANFNAGAFLWQGPQQELRIAAAGARMDELLFTRVWPKPDFALDFGIRID